MSIYRRTASAVLVLFTSASAFGQEAKVEPKPEIEGCNNEFARFLVDQQVSESRSIVATAKRVRILTRSADFIWKFDQPTARGYFTDAFKVATDHFREKGFEKKGDNRASFQLPDYRFEVIRAIAKKDAEWAKKLTEQLLKDFEKAAKDRTELDKRRELDSIMSIAQESVKTNPDLSWYLFRRAMKYPLDVHWYFALPSVAGKDRRFGDTLYTELLANYANETPRRLLFLSAYPFASQRVFGVDKFSYGTVMPAEFQESIPLQQRFLDFFLRRISAYASDPANLNKAPEGYYKSESIYMLTAIKEMEPVIIEKFPHLLQRLSEARAQANAAMTDELRKSMADGEKYNDKIVRTLEERLEEVEKADSEGKLNDWMIAQLLLWGQESKTEEQFAKIEPWLDKIRDETSRLGTIHYFWFLRAKRAIKDHRMDDARKFAEKVPELDHRAVLIFEIAEAQLKDLNEAAAVYQTLTDVSKVARQSEDSIAKARVHLGIAALYEKVNHTFALDELSDALKVINRLEDPDITSNFVYRQVSGKDFSFTSSFGIPGYDMESTFRLLSKTDFDMPLSNARTLNDKYFRTLAVIAIAQNCIDRPKPKPAVKATGPAN